MTIFADWSEQEFSSILTVTPWNNATAIPTIPSEHPAVGVPSLNPTILVGNPSSVDWRNQAGYLTGVKNQGGCGSCWAFAATSSFETAYKIQHPTTTIQHYSEQELVSCSIGAPYYNYGCNGGMYDGAWYYIYLKGGISLDSAYTYTSGLGANGTCKSSTTR